MYDFHSHTYFSGDSSAIPSEMVQSAIQKQLKGIALTDHVDLDYPHPDAQFDLDPAEHFAEVSALKNHFASRIFVAVGLEIGYQKSCESRIRALVRSNPYDFILLSLHTILGADLYVKSFFKNRTPLEAMTLYFQTLNQMVLDYDDFDILGHLDLPRRYHKPINDLPLEAYQDALIPLLKNVIKLNKGIEFNTSGYRYGDGAPYPTFEIAQLYYDLGGRKLSLGSDAHRPEDVGHHFNETAALLKDIGFKEAYYFNQRQAIPYLL